MSNPHDWFLRGHPNEQSCALSGFGVGLGERMVVGSHNSGWGYGAMFRPIRHRHEGVFCWAGDHEFPNGNGVSLAPID